MIPLAPSVIFTGVFVAIKRKQFNVMLYRCFPFSLITISSWLTIVFRRVLSSIRFSFASGSMATNGLDLKTSIENWSLLDPRDCASKETQYPSKSFLMILRTVPLPLPGAPYSTKNFSIFLLSPATTAPMAHSIFCLSRGAYSVSSNLSHASCGPSSRA